jgi:glutamate racemase
MKQDQPIGVLDSGVGGLSVVAALKNLMPEEAIYYVGDTQHMPYGNKSTLAIQGYVQNLGKRLIQQNCKAIVIACVTATSAAADLLQQQVGEEIPVINVVDPLIEHLQEHCKGQQLGLIATRYTIETNPYGQKLSTYKGNDITLRSLATPLLASAIEQNRPIEPLLERYLAAKALKDIEGLVLGCTHYWLIQEKIAAYYDHQVPIFSGAALVAQQVQAELIKRVMRCTRPGSRPSIFAMTKRSASFIATVKKMGNLLGEPDPILVQEGY